MKNRPVVSRGHLAALVLMACLLAAAWAVLGALPPAQAHDSAGPTGFEGEQAQALWAQDEEIEHSWQPDYLDLATGDPQLLAHGVYTWPFALNSIGWSMQSYQNYGSPYFHHGMDMMKAWGTEVFNRSGGQVVNIENYQPGWYLYWEVAVLDPDGYIWQYHHIQMETIPQAIWDAWYAYQDDPVNGGFIPPDTHIGNIVEWPVWSFDKQFNHIHLNILAAGGVYVNGFEFHNPLPDTVGPQIQAIGLLQNHTIYPGNTIEGTYSLYVRARDLVLDDVYYLPPWWISFSVDGGPEHTTWRFDTLPGGDSDTLYLEDFYVVPPTCGDYECREYAIDLGFLQQSLFSFPSAGGQHTVQVTVRDYAGNSASQSYTYNVIGSPPLTTVWQDDFEASEGWIPNPDGTDTATSGQWEVDDPEATYSGGPKQLGNTPSDVKDLATGHLAGADPGDHDIDGGVTTIRSPDIPLPAAESLTLSFRSYLAHGSNASSADYLRVMLVGSTSYTVLTELGAANNDNGGWTLTNVDITQFAGQTVYLQIAAADDAAESLIEAAIDDVLIAGTGLNRAPVANPQSVSTPEEAAVGLVLTGSDPDGDPITFSVVSSPTHGLLGGIAPNLVYTPAANYYGPDGLTFVVNDGQASSLPAEVSIEVTPVNDAPLADPQAVRSLWNLPVAITLSGSDVDGDTLTFSIATPPAHGTLSGTAPNLTYTPDPGYAGPDSFTFIASDGELESEPAAVEIAINYAVFVPLILNSR